MRVLLYKRSFPDLRDSIRYLDMLAVMMQWLEACMQMPKRRRMRGLPLAAVIYTSPMKICSCSIIVLTRLFLIVFALLLLLLALLSLELFMWQLFLPELVSIIARDVGKDDLENVRVPGHGFAFDAFFDVLESVSNDSVKGLLANVPRAAQASRSCCPVGR